MLRGERGSRGRGGGSAVMSDGAGVKTGGGDAARVVGRVRVGEGA